MCLERYEIQTNLVSGHLSAGVDVPTSLFTGLSQDILDLSHRLGRVAVWTAHRLVTNRVAWGEACGGFDWHLGAFLR